MGIESFRRSLAFCWSTLLITGCSVVAPEAREFVGKPAPHAGLAVGSDTLLLDRMRGSWVVLCFWETTCTFACSGLESCGEIAEEYSGKPVKVVAVSVDDAQHREKWEQRIADLGAPGLLQAFSGNGALDETYMRFKLNVVPSYVVVDPTGIVQAVTWRTSEVRVALKDVVPPPSQ